MHDRTRPPRDYLAWAALAAALVVTASAEYALARAAGLDEWTAAALPAALDIYAVRALRARRDVASAVAAMIATNAAAHLVSAGLLPVAWPLVVGVSAIAPLVLWRVHRLADVEAIVRTRERTLTAAAPVTPPPTAEPAGYPVQVTDPPAVQVTAEPPLDTDQVGTAPQASPLVICGDRQVYRLEVPAADNDDEVPIEQPERLSTDAARVVLESCWSRGTPPAEAARLATRSNSYAKKVFARLDDARGPALRAA
ncbi:hypothetical protein ACIQZO_26355 [Streptomyces sp. NPDC097617]|uniref:hypothetical protein n=1 Tax=Streptomyces sp. NPDC097617 TaxID=3366091 RepID=UPI0037F89B3F